MSKICYVDFDGVTHIAPVFYSRERGMHFNEAGHVLFEWMPILERLLHPYPDVQIVLSTAWVLARGYEFAKSQLSPALQTRVIGATFDSRYTQKLDFDLMPRGLQILRDAERRRPTSWFAIDNDDHGWPEACRDRLVRTTDRHGLDDPSVQDSILRMLNSL
ncbi:MAG: HAD domain-containing protein [Telluria sp.]